MAITTVNSAIQAYNNAAKSFGSGAVTDADSAVSRDEDALLALNEALDRLGAIDERALSIVELKFFCGFTNAEAARTLGISDATVEADWQFARSWLFGALEDKRPPSRV